MGKFKLVIQNCQVIDCEDRGRGVAGTINALRLTSEFLRRVDRDRLSQIIIKVRTGGSYPEGSLGACVSSELDYRGWEDKVSFVPYKEAVPEGDGEPCYYAGGISASSLQNTVVVGLVPLAAVKAGSSVEAETLLSRGGAVSSFSDICQKLRELQEKENGKWGSNGEKAIPMVRVAASGVAFFSPGDESKVEYIGEGVVHHLVCGGKQDLDGAADSLSRLALHRNSAFKLRTSHATPLPSWITGPGPKLVHWINPYGENNLPRGRGVFDYFGPNIVVCGVYDKTTFFIRRNPNACFPWVTARSWPLDIGPGLGRKRGNAKEGYLPSRFNTMHAWAEIVFYPVESKGSLENLVKGDDALLLGQVWSLFNDK